MFPESQGSHEESLDALFRAYGEACVTPEPSSNFMPHLWQRIEARQTFGFLFRRVAGGLVTAAIAATLAMALYLATPRHSPVFYTSTYVDVLAASHGTDSPDLYETVGYDPGNTADEL